MSRRPAPRPAGPVRLQLGGRELVLTTGKGPTPQGSALRNARVAAGLYVFEACAHSGISHQTWHAIEDGTLVPDDWAPLFEAVAP